MTGSVSVIVGQDAVALSEVLVVLEAEQPGEVVASSPTDLDGQFALRFGATLRNAQVCARPEGFETACELVSLSDEVPTRVELVVEPRDGLVYGTVLDLDGRPCFFDSASFDTAERTRVELLDSSSTRRTRPPHSSSGSPTRFGALSPEDDKVSNIDTISFWMVCGVMPCFLL